MFPINSKPVNWFPLQINWLISIWWGTLVFSGLIVFSPFTGHFPFLQPMQNQRIQPLQNQRMFSGGVERDHWPETSPALLQRVTNVNGFVSPLAWFNSSHYFDWSAVAITTAPLCRVLSIFRGLYMRRVIHRQFFSLLESYGGRIKG